MSIIDRGMNEVSLVGGISFESHVFEISEISASSVNDSLIIRIPSTEISVIGAEW